MNGWLEREREKGGYSLIGADWNGNTRCGRNTSDVSEEGERLGETRLLRARARVCMYVCVCVCVCVSICMRG